MLRVKKGDTVEITAGGERSRNGTVKKGEISRVIPSKRLVYVKGFNLVRKSIKKSKENPSGGFVEMESPLHISNVMLFCPKCGKGVKTQFVEEKDVKIRVCKKCGHKFD